MHFYAKIFFSHIIRYLIINHTHILISEYLKENLNVFRIQMIVAGSFKIHSTQNTYRQIQQYISLVCTSTFLHSNICYATFQVYIHAANTSDGSGNGKFQPFRNPLMDTPAKMLMWSRPPPSCIRCIVINPNDQMIVLYCIYNFLGYQQQY